MGRLKLLAMYSAAVLALLLRSAWAEPARELAKENATVAEAAEEAKFIRVRRDDAERPLAMETAVVHYTSKARPEISIDLVGAVFSEGNANNSQDQSQKARNRSENGPHLVVR